MAPEKYASPLFHFLAGGFILGAFFMATDMDVLVIENYVLRKEEQPETGAGDRETYLSQFALD